MLRAAEEGLLCSVTQRPLQGTTFRAQRLVPTLAAAAVLAERERGIAIEATLATSRADGERLAAQLNGAEQRLRQLASEAATLQGTAQRRAPATPPPLGRRICAPIKGRGRCW